MKKYVIPFLTLVCLSACFGKRMIVVRHDIFAIDLPLNHPEDTDYYWVMPPNKKMKSFGSKMIQSLDDSTHSIQQFTVQPKKAGKFSVWFYEVRNLHDGEFVVVNMFNKSFFVKK